MSPNESPTPRMLATLITFNQRRAARVLMFSKHPPEMWASEREQGELSEKECKKLIDWAGFSLYREAKELERLVKDRNN